MKALSIPRSQLYLMLAFTTVVPLIALVLGFYLALQYKQTDAHIANAPVTSEQVASAQTAIDEVLIDQELIHKAAPYGKVEVVDAKVVPSDISLPDTALAPTFEAASLVLEASKDAKEANEANKGKNDVAAVTYTEVDSRESLQGTYLLQTGAFSDKNRALHWAQTLRAKHSEVHVFSRDIHQESIRVAKKQPLERQGQQGYTDKSLLYVVTLGHFNSKKDAKRAAGELNRKHNLSVYVTGRSSLNSEIYMNGGALGPVAMR
jgi:cell division septation protein DedD